MNVCTQRRFDNGLQQIPPLIKNLGHIYRIEGKYCKNIARLDEGWRAIKSKSGGGALLDMGYHFIDILLWYFGYPKEVSAKIGKFNRVDQSYDVEDSISCQIYYEDARNPNLNTLGNLYLSRVSPLEEESLIIHGKQGGIYVEKNLIKIFDKNGKEAGIIYRENNKKSLSLAQLRYFHEHILMDKIPVIGNSYQHLQHMELISQIYNNSNTSQNLVNYYENEFLNNNELKRAYG